MNKDIMKKLILLALFLLSTVFAIVFFKSLGIKINENHFPDGQLRGSVRIFDSNKNGYLSRKELENAKNLSVLFACSDLSGIEHLTNLERLSLVECSDLSGIEKLPNLKSITLYNQCPDLSVIEKLSNIEEISIRNCVFNETFVFDKEISVTNFIFRDCIFENGLLFKNDSVEYVEFGYCDNGECEANGDLVFSDCEKLFWLRAEFESVQERRYNIDLSGCDNLDWLLISNEKEQINTSVDLSNCSKLRSVEIYDFEHKNDTENELTLNISGCANIKGAILSTGRLHELDISDCPYLITTSKQTPSERNFGGLRYESEEGWIETGNENLVFIK